MMAIICIINYSLFYQCREVEACATSNNFLKVFHSHRNKKEERFINKKKYYF